MESEIKKIKNTKRSNPFVLSILFLLFSIILTGGLYYYNITLQNENLVLDQEIETKESSISQLEKDSNILTSLIYNSNRSSIRRLENYSNITLFIDHITKIGRTYGIDFRAFNYSSGRLGLVAVASSDSSRNINYKKVSRFISEYRKNENGQSLFDLELVKNISTKNSGIDNVFNINLELKKNLDKIIQNLESQKTEINNQTNNSEEKTEFQKRKEALLKSKANKNNEDSSQ